MNINTKSLYKLTRQARAIKDRDSLSITGQSEMKTIMLCDELGIDHNLMTPKNYHLEKRVACIDEGLTIVNKLRDTDFKIENQNMTIDIGDGLSLQGTAHIIDGNDIHLLTLPYSLATLERNEEGYKSSSGWEDRLFNALGLLYINKLNGIDGDLYIHYVYVDTPLEYIGLDHKEIHILGYKLPIEDRLVTIKVSLDEENETLIKESLEKVKDFIKQGE